MDRAERLVDGAGVIHMDLKARTHSLSHTQEPGSMTKKDKQGVNESLREGQVHGSFITNLAQGLPTVPCSPEEMIGRAEEESLN